MWINLRSEYTFGSTFAHLKDIVKKISENKFDACGIADFCSTWSHVPFDTECKKQGIKPIFGVRIPVTDNVNIKERRYPFDVMSLIALTNHGLSLIYELVDIAHQQFYYKPQITYDQINTLPEKDVCIIGTFAPRFDLFKRHIYLELSPATPYKIRNLKNVDYIACSDNWYIDENQKHIYETIADERKIERKTTQMHILCEAEWRRNFPTRKEALKNKKKILKLANAQLSSAPMVKYHDQEIKLKSLCKEGAFERGIDLKNNTIYRERLKRELKLVKEKEFADYFLVVWDLIKYAKKHMFVGPARGSSAGSLICYLIGITEVDPIKYELIFERFIDINRKDLPDIDIDFQDDKRHMVIKYLESKYGKENVAQIGNISTYKPKSAIIKVCKALSIPPWEVEEFKNSIAERMPGDERANNCIEDSLISSDLGKETVAMYPNIAIAKHIEGHASHTSVHAAGIIVCNMPISKFCGINSRDNTRIAMIDKDHAEKLNLLKIDALGLRTLSVLSECCEMIGKNQTWLYNRKLNDKKTFKLFNEQRLTGIFQFEGDSIRKLAKRMPIENIDDLSALTSICRPGPLTVGSAERYVQCRSGEREIEYIGNNKIVEQITKSTMGEIIYQEQVMNILRLYANLPWEEVSILRKAMAKSKGDEAFLEHKQNFINGAKKVNSGVKDEEIEEVWNTIKAMGQYSFNLSHAVSYSIITYLSAYLKAHFPLEFAVSTLNNAKDESSCVKLLRDLRENDGIKHIPFDFDNSMDKWTIYKGKLLGSLSSIDGIGIVSARKVLKCRKENTTIPAGIKNKMIIAKTPYRYIYPAKQIYGEYYENPERYFIFDNIIVTMDKMNCDTEYCVIGKMTRKIVRDMNEESLVKRRKGHKIEDGNTKFLSMTFEDDTKSVYATIGYGDFEELGKEIIDGKVDFDWYLIFGKYNQEFNSLYIKNIRKITK